jgi:hypothetical protein
VIYTVVAHGERGRLLHRRLPALSKERALAWGFAQIGLPGVLFHAGLFLDLGPDKPWAVEVRRLGSRRTTLLLTDEWQAACDRNLRTLAHLSPAELARLALSLPAERTRLQEEEQRRQERLEELAMLKASPQARSRRSPLSG